MSSMAHQEVVGATTAALAGHRAGPSRHRRMWISCSPKHALPFEVKMNALPRFHVWHSNGIRIKLKTDSYQKTTLIRIKKTYSPYSVGPGLLVSWSLSPLVPWSSGPFVLGPLVLWSLGPWCSTFEARGVKGDLDITRSYILCRQLEEEQTTGG